jgi:phage gp29-like protein
MLMDYLQRCALPFAIYYYDAANSNGLEEAKAYAARQSGSQAIFWPRYKDQKDGGYGIEIIQPSTSGAQLLETLITSYFDDVMRRYILGQDLSSESSSTGIGSGLSDLHSQTLARIIKYDAVGLSDTLTTDLVRVLYKYNCPNVPPSKFQFDIDVPNAENVIEYASQIYEMGGPINLDQLYVISGLSKPAKGSSILSKLGNLQPTATAANNPDAIPAQGNSGPNPPQGVGNPPSQ